MRSPFRFTIAERAYLLKIYLIILLVEYLGMEYGDRNISIDEHHSKAFLFDIQRFFHKKKFQFQYFDKRHKRIWLCKYWTLLLSGIIIQDVDGYMCLMY